MVPGLGSNTSLQNNHRFAKTDKKFIFSLFEKHFMDVLWFSSMQLATTSNTLLKTKNYFQSVLPTLSEYVKQKWEFNSLVQREILSKIGKLPVRIEIET